MRRTYGMEGRVRHCCHSADSTDLLAKRKRRDQRAGYWKGKVSYSFKSV